MKPIKWWQMGITDWITLAVIIITLIVGIIGVAHAN